MQVHIYSCFGAYCIIIIHRLWRPGNTTAAGDYCNLGVSGILYSEVDLKSILLTYTLIELDSGTDELLTQRAPHRLPCMRIKYTYVYTFIHNLTIIIMTSQWQFTEEHAICHRPCIFGRECAHTQIYIYTQPNTACLHR